MLTDEELQKLATLLRPTIEHELERTGIDRRRHVEEHDFLAQWMKARAKRQAMWARIKESVLGYLIIVLLGGSLVFVGTAVYRYVAALLLRQH